MHDQDVDIEFIDDEELKYPEKSELLRALETSKCFSLQRTAQKNFCYSKKNKVISEIIFMNFKCIECA